MHVIYLGWSPSNNVSVASTPMDLRGDRRVTDVLMVDISRLYRVEPANIAPSSISGHDAMSGTLVVIDDIL